MQTTTGIKRGEGDTCRDESEREVPFKKGTLFLVITSPVWYFCDLFSLAQPSPTQPNRVDRENPIFRPSYSFPVIEDDAPKQDLQ